MATGEGAAGWVGSGLGWAQGGLCLAEPLSQESSTLCPAVPVRWEGELSPPSPDRARVSQAARVSPNPFLAEPSALAATSSFQCAADGSRPALAQTSLGTALDLARPGWAAPSTEVSAPFPCSPVRGGGCVCWGWGAGAVHATGDRLGCA